MTPEHEEIVNEVIERAEQACRYALKHNQDAWGGGDVDKRYKSGFEVACSVCEGAIRRQVMSHIEDDLKRVLSEQQ